MNQSDNKSTSAETHTSYNICIDSRPLLKGTTGDLPMAALKSTSKPQNQTFATSHYVTDDSKLPSYLDHPVKIEPVDNCNNYGNHGLMEVCSSNSPIDVKSYCKLCESVFVDSHSLATHACPGAKHKRSHIPECTRSAMKARRSVRTNALAHYIMVKKRVSKALKAPQVYTCKICREQFVMKILLRRHVKAAHAENQLVCNGCSEVFVMQDALTNHKCSYKKPLQNGKKRKSRTINKTANDPAKQVTSKQRSKQIRTAPYSRSLIIKWPVMERISCKCTAASSETRTDDCSCCMRFVTLKVRMRRKDQQLLNGKKAVVMLTKSRVLDEIALKLADISISLVANKIVDSDDFACEPDWDEDAKKPKRTSDKESRRVCGIKTTTKRNSYCTRYRCDTCEIWLSSERGLNRHLTSMHGAECPWECAACGKEFSSCESYNEHTRPTYACRQFACDICEKRFVTKRNLVSHQTCHGKPSAMCEICGKKFSNNGSLKRHERIHSGEKPYKCIVCKYACNQQSQLKNHCVHTHGKMNWQGIAFGKSVYCKICNMHLDCMDTYSRHARSRCTSEVAEVQQ